MPDPTPRAWLCKHCGERVDPTMDLCWNCGHDREGVAHPTVFVEPVEVDLTRCGNCEYELRGNPDATHCPECGRPVPWIDCPDCGVRGARHEMISGCPACRAAQTGQMFEPEVRVVKDADNRETYETVFEQQAVASGRAQQALSRYRLKRIVALALMIMPGCLVVSWIYSIFDGYFSYTVENGIVLFWFICFLVAFVEVVRAVNKDASDFED